MSSSGNDLLLSAFVSSLQYLGPILQLVFWFAWVANTVYCVIPMKVLALVSLYDRPQMHLAVDVKPGGAELHMLTWI